VTFVESVSVLSASETRRHLLLVVLSVPGRRRKSRKKEGRAREGVEEG